MKQHGFTIFELTIGVTLAAFVSMVLLSITIYFFADLQRSDTESKLVLEAQGVLRTVVEDLRTGTAVRTTNANVDSNAPAGGWQTSNPNNILIIASPVLNMSNNFVVDPETGEPYNNEYVFFSSGGVFYKRVLTNASAAGNSEKMTCPSASASPTCPADKILSENSLDLEMTFYDQDDAVTTDPDLARSVLLNVYLGKTVFGKPININDSIRVTLRNGAAL